MASGKEIKGKIGRIGADALPPTRIIPFYHFPVDIELNFHYEKDYLVQRNSGYYAHLIVSACDSSGSLYLPYQVWDRFSIQRMSSLLAFLLLIDRGKEDSFLIKKILVDTSTRESY